MTEHTVTIDQPRTVPVPEDRHAPPPAIWEQALTNRRNSSEFQVRSMFGLLWVPVLTCYLVMSPLTYELTLWVVGEILYSWFPEGGPLALVLLALHVAVLHVILVWAIFLGVRWFMDLRVRARVRRVTTRLCLSDLALMIADPQHPGTQAALGINRRAGVQRLRLHRVIDSLATRFDRWWAQATPDRAALRRADDWAEPAEVQSTLGCFGLMVSVVLVCLALAVSSFLAVQGLALVVALIWHSRLVTRSATVIAICDFLTANDSSRYLQGWYMAV